MDVYLDNAATSHPKPKEVLEAVQAALTLYNGNPGRSGHRRALAGARALLACRESLGQMLGAKDSLQVLFAFNCTDALNMAIKGSLQPGDHVVTTALEHNSVLRPLTGLKDRDWIDVTTILPNSVGFVEPEAIRHALRPNTRLVIVCHASNVTGVLQPVAEIGEVLQRAGVPYLVDGAQALGETPVDVVNLRASLYAFPGHKGLLGPQGTGGLYVQSGYAMTTLREGGTGSSSESTRQPAEQPDRYESGTMNLHGLAGLDAGARFVLKNGLTLRAHARALTSQLLEGLRKIEGVTVYAGEASARERVGVVSFNAGDLPSGPVADALDRAGFQVRGGLHCAPGTHGYLGTLARGAVRASPGWQTQPDEIDAFLKTVDGIVRNGL